MAEPALIKLLAPSEAPGFRESLTQSARFSVVEVAPGYATVRPLEGAGADCEYLRLTRLCDASTPLTEAVWKPLLDHPARATPDDTQRQQLFQASRKLQAHSDDILS